MADDKGEIDQKRQSQFQAVYSGAVDWNHIYRCFHPPMEIARRLAGYFEKDQATPLLLCGFAEVAFELQEMGYAIRYVDFSEEMAIAARRDFPGLRSVEVADVLTLLESDPSPNIAIVCRVSAYWQTKSEFEKLVSAIRRFPRQRVLLDFYDRDAAETGVIREFCSDGGSGTWKFLSFQLASVHHPRIEVAEMQVDYNLKEGSLSYLAHRTHLRRQEIAEYFKLQFPDSAVSVHGPLVPNDESFLLVIE